MLRYLIPFLLLCGTAQAQLADIVQKDSTDRSVTVYIFDSSDGTPETSVVYNTSGIDLWYRREGGTKVSITEADLATPALDDAHADGGFLAIGDGVYRLDLPDAAFATGANYVDFGGTVTGMIVRGGRVRLVDWDIETALVTQADITGGAYALDTDANGRVRVVDGTGAGEIDTSSGTVLLSATTEGQIDAIETDTAAQDTANELRALLTGDTAALVDANDLPSNFSSLVISGAGAVDSLLQGFLNNTIAESTADNIAGNFETFWDNGDAATTNTVDDVGGGSSGGGQDYYFAGKTSGALVFQRVDGSTAATPFVSVQSADSANFYNYSSNSMAAWNSIDGAEWTNYVSAMFTALDNTSPTPVAIPQYDTQDQFTSLATGLYIVQIYASDTYKDPMVARCLLYYDGAAWSEPTSNVNTQLDKIKRATIAN